MKLLLLDPNFYKSALLMDNKKRCFNHVIVCSKLLNIFEQQKTNLFLSVPNYRVWKGYEDALKLYFNCLLKVCKDIHHVNTKYEYFKDINQEAEFPSFTELTFKSHQAFCINLDYNLYFPKFSENINFNGGILIWEYLEKDNQGCIIRKAEDLNGIYKPEKNEGYVSQFVYDLKEINKENFKIGQ